MILILSSKHDFSTTRVCRWIQHLGSDFKVITDEDLITNVTMELIAGKWKVELELNGVEQVNLSEFEAFWFRRGDLNFDVRKTDSDRFNNYLSIDLGLIKRFVFKYIEAQMPAIGSYYKEVECSRLEQAIAAAQAGFNIPDTIVTTRKLDLNDFTSKNNPAIVKNLRYSLRTSYENKNVVIGHTEILNQKTVEQLKDQFPPALAQQCVPKKYEVRAFYLLDKIFAAAIYTQKFEATQIDSRKKLVNEYDEKPLRVEPIQLPDEVQEKIRQVMKKLEMNTGSFDFIYSEANEYSFLEINHIGQYDWISSTCNYNLDKEIAVSLIQLEKNGKNKNG